VRVAIIDYGIGNLGSLVAAFRRLGLEPEVWRGGSAIAEEQRAVVERRIDLVVLPGVGSLRHAADALKARGLWDLALEAHARDLPLLGICLGMQLFFQEGEEGGPGLGLLAGSVPRLKAQRLPHIGWNTAELLPGHPLPTAFEGLALPAWFYFVHSFRVNPLDPTVIQAVTRYGGEGAGGEIFPAVVGADNLLGVQFHPELSGAAGHRLLSNILGEVARHGTLAGTGPV
jgi:glutamine amidotransferase